MPRLGCTGCCKHADRSTSSSIALCGWLFSSPSRGHQGHGCHYAANQNPCHVLRTEACTGICAHTDTHTHSSPCSDGGSCSTAWLPSHHGAISFSGNSLPVLALQPVDVVAVGLWDIPIIVDEAQLVVRLAGVQLQGKVPLGAQRCIPESDMSQCLRHEWYLVSAYGYGPSFE